MGFFDAIVQKIDDFEKVLDTTVESLDAAANKVENVADAVDQKLQTLVGDDLVKPSGDVKSND